ncbi:protein DSF2 [Paraphaeosphaeria sporulosa]
MTLKDLLKKKDKVRDEGNVPDKGPTLSPDVPEFQFYRTTTTTRESIEPPAFPGDPTRAAQPFLAPAPEHRGFKGRFRRHSNAAEPAGGQESDKGGHKLHFGRGRSASSVNVPSDLPAVGGDGVARNEDEEANWEKRATVLISGNTVLKSGGNTPTIEVQNPLSPSASPSGRSRRTSVGAAPDDADIQEAIRLHEAGDYAASTQIFGRLADPNGANNALSQVLYGLALRHGWGCEPNMEQAVRYLSVAASNSAEVERLALQAGMKKGGAAKGELVIAMFELGNCFRYAWGTKKDPVAAKQYYETAANLGDTDAMNEVAWCYVEGFGTKKDKFKAAQFLRLAESKGSKTLGNTW